ncbi:MAG: rRNA pseudouridine synthase, partial [Thermotogae bacterium]
MRLDRFLSNARGIGRRRIKKIIRKGSVAVNNRVVKDPSFTVGNEDAVSLNGELITFNGKIYIALNKPSGYT